MSVIKLPEGKTPAEAAHDLVMALVSSGHFPTEDKNAEEIYRIVQEAEEDYRLLYQRKLDLLTMQKDRASRQTWANLVR